eukprot:TRINITY_DN335_c0_g1_i2.p1 TRINITY_DN335_c0_g1~~TRINITY_DN335_c0_g1_i2.p1  ORF type:complete len:138 (-),score=38.86 TRINITY_DN335_c0_g1_i2:73-486(-)
MSMSLWNNWDLMDRDFFGRSGRSSNRDLWMPTMDVKEGEKSITVHAELPGIKKEDISIRLDDNVLTISGERRQEKKEDNEKYHRVERSYGKFSRSVQVPRNVTEEQIKASFTNGVLELSFPKSEPQQQQKRQIQISG